MQLKGESGGSPGELITVSAMSMDNQLISFPDSSIPVPSQLFGVLRVAAIISPSASKQVRDNSWL